MYQNFNQIPVVVWEMKQVGIDMVHQMQRLLKFYEYHSYLPKNI
jgi:hypothetical protein